MKILKTILWGERDGGPESNVRYYGIEIKKFFSITLLCFGKGSRPVYHSHAFNSISWVLTGGLFETKIEAKNVLSPRWHWPSVVPVMTYRTTYHQVMGVKDKNWVISFRGPWKNRWYEHHPDKSIVLTHGRKVVDEVPSCHPQQ